jgi:DNA modification methylase
MIKVYVGDNRETLKSLADESVHTCITSPPYWGLRDYGEDEQLGLEETPEKFVENLVEVFREVKRVLRDDGTVWLNLGDSYISGKSRYSTKEQTLSGGGENQKKYGSLHKGGKKDMYGHPFYKDKDLAGIPWRVAFALQADGWYLRQDIIWHKPNPMPESVKDRCTKAHEYIFLLSKNARYYFDHEAIKEDGVTKGFADSPSSIKAVDGVGGSRDNIHKYRGSNKSHGKYKNQETEAKNRQGLHANRGDKLIEVREGLPEQSVLVEFLRSRVNAKTLADNTDIPLTKIEHWFRKDKTGFSYPSIEDWKKVREFVDDFSNEFYEIDKGLSEFDLKTDEVVINPKRNKRSVWTVTTKPFKGAHFATFPMDLIEPCVLAGCPEGGVVLDPFGGSGTTAQVANGFNRDAILCELSQDYVEIMKKRLNIGQDMFVEMEIIEDGNSA